jgi:tRNA (guanosine-2'-O-)-methyltransferase
MRRDDPDACEIADQPRLPAPADQVIDALSPLLTDERLVRVQACVARRTRAIVPVLEAIDDPHNVAAILRSADAFGVQEVHLIEGAQPFLAARAVTQGAERWLDVVRHDGPEQCVASLQSRGFRVYVATMDGELTPEDLPEAPRVAVVFGNEQTGASKRMRTLCDGFYTIPMYGFAQSLNVSVAAAITLFSATRSGAPPLADDDRACLLARFMMLSVPRAEEVVLEHLSRRRA